MGNNVQLRYRGGFVTKTLIVSELHQMYATKCKNAMKVLKYRHEFQIPAITIRKLVKLAPKSMCTAL